MPDFGVIRDVWNRGHISEKDYTSCFSYDERPPCEGLRPYDYVPEEMKKKQETANRVVVTESRREAMSGSAANGRWLSG
jgi:hypothetical protein